jgi:ElaB/YqjD/DUF883 family membrane-anchored ribosome-binding protein
MDTPSSTSTTGNGAAGSPQKVVDKVAKSAHEAVDRMAAAAGPAIEKLSSSYANAGDTLRTKADQFGAMEEQWLTGARTYVRDHPLAAVAIGVFAGFVIGKLTRSSD